MATQAGVQGVDEQLYSRQLYVIGHAAASRLASSQVFITGLGGLGVEVAKNVILSGVKSVTLHDTKVTTWRDLSSQYFLTSDDLGQNRASACCGRLAELNPYVTVTSSSRPLTRDFLVTFDVVVLTDSPLEEQLRLSQLCHEENLPFVMTSAKGLFGHVFCDLGERFEVPDPTGKDPVTCRVDSVTREEEGLVTLPGKTYHNLHDGSLVTFSGVRGMTQLNLPRPHSIKVVTPFSFTIGDTREFPEYEGGGVAKEVKVGLTMSFKSLKESLADPDITCIDITKEEKVGLVHQAFLTLHQYVAVHGSPPRPWHHQDAIRFLKMFREANKTRELEAADEDLLKTFAFTSSGEVAPMNAVIGSIASQEVMKACSGKFTPLHQWLYFDALECLPEDTSMLRDGVCDARGTRYDAQVAIFGPDFQERLGKLKYFVVGAGAIGCELLKNFAMLGVGAGGGGGITLTDMDTIEKSNLSRQFLFRQWDIKKPKSDIAASAVARMNPDVHVTAHQVRVGPETEHVYDGEFYEGLDGVANALDNVETRRYMDRCCWHYRKPLLESGTLGTNGSVQVVVPHLTERYTFFQPSSDSIPMCTLRNFPSEIEHTLQWARNLFQGEFCNAPEIAKQYIQGTKTMEDILRISTPRDDDILKSLKSTVVDDLPGSYDDCVTWARRQWQDLYHNNILDLLRDLPPDLKTRNGAPFWSGSKRCPHPLTFDSKDSLHLDYVHAAANLKAQVYGIEQVTDRSITKKIVSSVTVASYVPRPKTIVLDGEVSDRLQDLYISGLQEAIPPPQSLAGLSLSPLSFEKDDDSNFHIDFIVSASNLRAGNYDIEPADRHKSKKIAGRIIPAIVTSTALVSGLVSLELLKVTQGHKDLARYKNTEFNLGLVRFCTTEPEPAPQNTYNDVTWTPWDRFEVEGDMTLQEFFCYFQEHHQLRGTMVSMADYTVYSFMLPKPERQRRYLMKITDILKEVISSGEGEGDPGRPGVEKGPSLGPVLMLDICADDRDGKDVDVPHVRYTVRKTS